MKGTLTQYVTLGVMLVLLVLIVSLFPEQQKEKATGQRATSTEVSTLSLPTRIKSERSN